MNTKTIAVALSGGGDIREVTIQPGTTAADVKNSLDLKKYWLKKPGSSEYFGDSEPLFSHVEDGDKIEAVLKAVVGSILEPILLLSIAGAGCGAWVGYRASCRRAAGRSDGNGGVPQRASGMATILVRPGRTPAHGGARGRAVPTRAGGVPVRVGPDTRPYWAQSAWRRKENVYSGYYRTKFGSWEGRVVEHVYGLLDVLVVNPPHRLLVGPYRRCLMKVGQSEYRIHFKVKTGDVSSAIRAVQRALEESFDCQVAAAAA